MAKKISLIDAARTFAEAMDSAHDQSSIVTQCVSICSGHFQGDTPTKAQVNEFATEVAKLRDWSEASERARKSEIRNIVREYKRLPDAIKAVRDNPSCDSFTWHNAVKVARLAKSHTTDKALVAAFFETKPSAKQTPSKKIESAVKALANLTVNTPKQKAFIAAVLKAADTAGVNYE